MTTDKHILIWIAGDADQTDAYGDGYREGYEQAQADLTRIVGVLFGRGAKVRFRDVLVDRAVDVVVERAVRAIEEGES